MKTNSLIKIRLSDEDRETLSDMLSWAVSYMVEFKSWARSKSDADYYLNKEKKFKALRHRIVFEELEDES